MYRSSAPNIDNMVNCSQKSAKRGVCEIPRSRQLQRRAPTNDYDTRYAREREQCKCAWRGVWNSFLIGEYMLLNRRKRCRNVQYAVLAAWLIKPSTPKLVI